ncbi:hypothetical protein [Bacillus proteolyticus]|uniref:hypothetical protein n=1 Tax=Bacillus proteolyticus TaxID=2026192 RepID=UPI003D025822
MKKIIPIVALIGMMSLGIQEMNVKAETYKSAGSKMDFWNSKRGTASISEKTHAKQSTIKRANFTLSRVKLALLLIHVFYLEIFIEFHKIKPNRNLNNLQKKYMKLSKKELAQRLILAEEYIAENNTKWVSSYFESFK